VNAGPAQYAVLSTVVFALGISGVLLRRSSFSVLFAVVLLFLAPVIALAGFTHSGASGGGPAVGDALALMGVVAAAAEAAAGAALALLAWRRIGSVSVNDLADPGG
jgi:NADH-quinone oxidoreductase subunit K